MIVWKSSIVHLASTTMSENLIEMVTLVTPKRVPAIRMMPGIIHPTARGLARRFPSFLCRLPATKRSDYLWINLENPGSQFGQRLLGTSWPVRISSYVRLSTKRYSHLFSNLGGTP